MNQQNRAARGAEETMQRLKAVFDASPIAIITYDCEGVVTGWSPAAERLFGWSEEEVKGQAHPWQTGVGADQIRTLLTFVASGESITGMDTQRQSKGGSVLEMRSSVAPLPDAQGAFGGMVEMVMGMAGVDLAEERLHALTRHDPLTGLPNRVHYQEMLEELVSARPGRSPLMIMQLDLDDLQAVNNTFGLAAGDAVIRAAADRLRAAVGGSEGAARIGGDAFGLFAPVTSVSEVPGLVKRILEDLCREVKIGEHEIRLHASAGVAMFPSDAGTATELIRAAEVAMQRAKQQKKGGYELYVGEMSAAVMERLTLESGMRKAMDAGHFSLHYQAKVEISTGRIVGAEALARWIDPEKGTISPGRFIPVAEESGLIIPLGEWIAHTACAQAKAWIDEGLPPVQIAINVSVHQMNSGSLAQTIRRAVDAVRLDPRYLEIEITESEIMRNAELSIAILRELKEMNISISIDDFGTGYSSLSYLKRFPIDTLKIDQAFVRDITTNPEDAAISSAIIAMAHRLNLKVIAEGVETEGQLGYLYSQDCDQIQGYYFSRPLPAAEFGKLIAAGTRLALGEGLRNSRGRVLLLVDDDESLLGLLKRQMRQQDVRILTASSARAGLEILATNKVGVIVSDQGMPGMTGVEFLSRVKNMYPATVRIVLSGHHELGVVTDAINKGAIYKFVPKPWDEEVLRATIRSGFQIYEAAVGRAAGE